MSKANAGFANHTQFPKMTENTSPLIKESDCFYILIGKIIDLVFEETKSINYEYFLKLYQFMFSNIFGLLNHKKLITKEENCGIFRKLIISAKRNLTKSFQFCFKPNWTE